MTAVGSIGRYPTVRVLGEGGMGTVYLARDPIIGRLVAIKVLRAGVGGPAARARLLQEARAAGRLSHPNIVAVFHADEEDGHPYFVMEYVEGQTLAAIIRDGPALPAASKLAILERVCSALACAHEAGLVHRDIKPTNIIVNATFEPKVLDFGLAKLHDAPLTLTQEHAIVGTLSYMAPEQLTGGDVDHRSDLFATAAVAYELLTGRRAFVGTAPALVERLLHPSPDAGIDTDGLEPELASILARGLDPRPDHRFQSAREFGQALREVRQLGDADLSFEASIEDHVGAPTIQPAIGTREAAVDAVELPVSHRERRPRPTPPSLDRAAAAVIGLTGAVTLAVAVALGLNAGRTDTGRVENSGATASPPPAAVRARAVPAGTALVVGILTRLDSRVSAKGDQFTGALAQPVASNGQLVVPAGTRVEGRIDRVGVTDDGRTFMELILTGMVDGRTLIALQARSHAVVAPSTDSGSGVSALIIGGPGSPGLVTAGETGAVEYQHTRVSFSVAETVNLQ